jgi:hypothetical protein
MKKLGTTIAALFTLVVSFANLPVKVERTLKWSEESRVYPYENGDPVYVLRFEGAVYDEEHPALPYFSERFRLDSYGEFTAILTNPVFESFNTRSIEDDAAISNDIRVSTEVEKDRLDYFGRVRVIPIRKVGEGRYDRLVSFELRLIFSPKAGPAKLRGGNTFTSVLSDGDIYKFAVNQSGVFRLDYNFLKNQLNIPIDNIDPRTIKLYGNGGGILPERAGAARPDDLMENAIEIVGEADGRFDGSDYLLFYGQGPDIWYYDSIAQTFSYPKNFYDTENYYFIKVSPGNGLRIVNQPSLTGSTYASTTFNDFLHYEVETTNLLHEWSYGQGSGRQWFGDYFKVKTAENYLFNIPDLLPAVPVKMKTAFAARIAQGTTARYSITANGTKFVSSNFNTTKGGSTDTYASLLFVSGEFVPGSQELSIALDFANANNSFNEGWLDFMEFNFQRQLRMSGDQMIFRDVKSIGQPVSTFKLGNANNTLSVWDITNPLIPARQETVLSGSELSFSTQTTTLKEFIAFNNTSNFLAPQKAIGKVENQNYHALSEVEMAIVYPADFKSEAERLAEHRRSFSKLKVELIDIEKLYNEFSSGRKDASAIRDFAKMLFERNPVRFRSLLLFGDGSFDSRNLYNLGGDFIPVYETVNSLSPIYAYPSDDYFAMLSDNEGDNIGQGSLDIGIGRLPVKDIEEARNVVNKIIHYDVNPGNLRDWRNRLLFIGDDEDGNLHTGDADGIAIYIGEKNQNLNIDKVYLDAFPQIATPGGTRVPLATDAVNNDVFKGVLAMIYLGHGGTKGWTQERVVKIEDILSWKNLDRLPIIITATCSFSGYDNPSFTTAGELSFLNNEGGAIALYTTVRPVFASSNEALTRKSVDTLFYKFDHERPSLGEVLRLSKNQVGDKSNSRKFTLLGDPAQKLALPNYQVITTKINDHDISSGIVDTLRALQKVTIEGQIQDDFGQLLTDFNGIVYPTIYDKKVRYRTLSQDAGSPPFDFDLQKNIIFKGRASVTNGRFKFTFVVPKDIDYNFGECKISYYAASESRMDDAAGNYQQVIVGGTGTLADDRGPKVEVFMNDERFVFGGITSTDPVLLVKLEDNNGINVVGNSIGHDLAGILDKNTQQTYILNDFYEAALDDYTKGEVRYPLYNLAEGRHEIKVNAWDIANNPAEGYTEFVVVTSEELALKHVLNYPNPFTSSTCFMFEHNQAGVELDVMVQIYTVSGRLIKTLEERIISTGYRLGSDNCIRWEGRDDYGDPLAKGVYLYKVKVKSANTGEVTLEGESEFEKLVILK